MLFVDKVKFLLVKLCVNAIFSPDVFYSFDLSHLAMIEI